jgi:hypothetical protein
MSRQSRHPSARTRGRARRRLRYLRQLRELQLRDLGGFVFDLYRFGEQREHLVRAKLDALIATDKEVRALRELLGEVEPDRSITVRVPGVGGSCATCGAFHSSADTFCASCGAELAGATPPAPPVQPVPAPQDTEVTALPPDDGGVAEPAVAEPAAEEPAVEEPADEEPVTAEPAAAEEAPVEEPAAAEEAPVAEESPVVEEPVGEVGEPHVVELPQMDPAAEPPAEDGPDPTGEIAAVGPRRVRQGRPRRRRGSSR